MKDLKQKLQRWGTSQAPVYLHGETGTGKELAGKALHALSPRKAAPYVAINCAAFSESLLESEIFGHVKGAFTGAEDKKGVIEQAEAGTLLLDEIGSMPSRLQEMLLRVAEDGVYRRVGDSRERTANVRWIIATHVDLIADPKFRSDLLARLGRNRIRLPPVRERGSDVGHLLCHLLARQLKGDRARVTIRDDATTLLQMFSWRQNVREIQGLAERISLVVTKPEVEITTALLDQVGVRLPQPGPALLISHLPDERLREHTHLHMLLKRVAEKGHTEVCATLPDGPDDRFAAARARVFASARGRPIASTALDLLSRWAVLHGLPALERQLSRLGGTVTRIDQTWVGQQLLQGTDLLHISWTNGRQRQVKVGTGAIVLGKATSITNIGDSPIPTQLRSLREHLRTRPTLIPVPLPTLAEIHLLIYREGADVIAVRPGHAEVRVLISALPDKEGVAPQWTVLEKDQPVRHPAALAYSFAGQPLRFGGLVLAGEGARGLVLAPPWDETVVPAGAEVRRAEPEPVAQLRQYKPPPRRPRRTAGTMLTEEAATRLTDLVAKHVLSERPMRLGHFLKVSLDPDLRHEDAEIAAWLLGDRNVAQTVARFLGGKGSVADGARTRLRDRVAGQRLHNTFFGLEALLKGSAEDS